MSEKIKAILDVVADKVFAYRPADKGEWAKKNQRVAKRQAKLEAQSDE